MKKILIAFAVVVALLFSFNTASAQFKVKYGMDNYNEGALAYNFFVGDNEMFKTTIKGFGSGFLLDIFTGRYSSDLVVLGWENFNLSAGLGIAITKYRFEENLVLDKVNDQVIAYIDDNPDHDYQNTFFGYGKSKIVYGSLFTPVNLNLKINDKIRVSTGAMLDFYISGKHKRKYIEDGEKKKVKVGNKDFQDYNLSKTKLGLSGRIEHIPTGLNICVTYMATPFFNDDSMPEINEMRIAIGKDFGKKYLDKFTKRERVTKEI